MEENTEKSFSPSLVFGVLASVAAVFAGSALLNLKTLSEELQIEQDVKVDPSTTPLAVKLRIHITLKNPTNGTITVKRPVTTIYFNNEVIATSDTVSPQDYILPRFGQVTLDPYLVTVSLLSTGIAAADFIKNLSTNRAIAIRARSLTLINGQFPFTKETVVQLLKNKA